MTSNTRELVEALNGALQMMTDQPMALEPFARVRQAITALEQQAQGGGWISVYDRLPNPDEHHRVLIYTSGYDFGGEQFFDVLSESLNECAFSDPESQPEVCQKATHWMPLPLPPAPDREEES